jgi:Ligated ion channel L-glutamate- and glycine-binding site
VHFQEAPYLLIRRKVSEDGHPLVGNNRYDGYCAELIKKIADIVHFEYLMREVKDGKFGAVENGTWNGMVGELIREVSYRLK